MEDPLRREIFHVAGVDLVEQRVPLRVVGPGVGEPIARIGL
jgi:hypothetical protein